jgi:polyisoprenoid-binding protein YceI
MGSGHRPLTVLNEFGLPATELAHIRLGRLLVGALAAMACVLDLEFVCRIFWRERRLPGRFRARSVRQPDTRDCGSLATVTDATWTLDPSDGELLIHTGVDGRAAKMGHRLTIAMTAWRATVEWADSEPTGVEVSIDVGSLDVVSGTGGLTPLTGPEKALARANALKVLDAKRFPQIGFTTADVEKRTTGYLLTGVVELHGKSREHVIDLQVDDLGDAWHISCEAAIRHSDFGMKPYSMLMGSMKVADAVTVSFSAQRAKKR